MFDVRIVPRTIPPFCTGCKVPLGRLYLGYTAPEFNVVKQEKKKFTLIPALCLRQRPHLTVPARPDLYPGTRFPLIFRSRLKGYLRSCRDSIHVEQSRVIIDLLDMNVCVDSL